MIRNNCFKVVPTTESKDKTKKYEELWIKIRVLIISMNKNLNDYDENYMRTTFNQMTSYF